MKCMVKNIVPPRGDISDLVEPGDDKGIGDVAWIQRITGFSLDKINRLCRKKIIPGAFKAQPGEKGSAWSFRKKIVLEWLDRLTTREPVIVPKKRKSKEPAA
jgi:hypothetical protein